MSTKHLTYTRPDGVTGVGFFIPWAGKYTHSVSWPDLPAERYSVDRLDRMGVKVDGLETIGGEGREYLSERGMEPVETIHLDTSDETEQETGGETSGQADEQTVPPVVDVSPSVFTESGSQSEASTTGDVTGGVAAELVDPSTTTDETTTANVDPTNATSATETTEVTDDATVSESTSEPVSEAQSIRDYLSENPNASNKEVVEALGKRGVQITSSQVTRERKAAASKD